MLPVSQVMDKKSGSSSAKRLQVLQGHMRGSQVSMAECKGNGLQASAPISSKKTEERKAFPRKRCGCYNTVSSRDYWKLQIVSSEMEWVGLQRLRLYFRQKPHSSISWEQVNGNWYMCIHTLFMQI